MKKAYFAVLIFAVLLSSCSKKNNNQQPDPKSVAEAMIKALMEGDEQDQTKADLMREYVVALDSFALAIPIIGNDTEADWASDKVHKMAQEVLGENCGYDEMLAKTCLMQSYVAYGMSYYSAILCNTYDTNMAHYVMATINRADSLYVALGQEQFDNLDLQCAMQFGSLMDLQMLQVMQNTVLEKQGEKAVFDKEAFGISQKIHKMVETLMADNQYSEDDIARFATILEGSAFFMTIAPYSNAFATSAQTVDRNKSAITAMANFFDEQSAPLKKAMEEHKTITPISDDDFISYLNTSIKYKSLLLNILTQEIRALQKK